MKSVGPLKRTLRRLSLADPTTSTSRNDRNERDGREGNDDRQGGTENERTSRHPSSNAMALPLALPVTRQQLANQSGIAEVPCTWDTRTGRLRSNHCTYFLPSHFHQKLPLEEKSSTGQTCRGVNHVTQRKPALPDATILIDHWSDTQENRSRVRSSTPDHSRPGGESVPERACKPSGCLPPHRPPAHPCCR